MVVGTIPPIATEQAAETVRVGAGAGAGAGFGNGVGFFSFGGGASATCTVVPYFDQFSFIPASYARVGATVVFELVRLESLVQAAKRATTLSDRIFSAIFIIFFIEYWLC